MFRPRERGVARRDRTRIDEACEYDALARARRGEMRVGIETPGIVRKSREKRSLREIEVRRIDAEVRASRRLYAVDVGPHRRAVRVRLENLTFRKAVFQPHRNDDLFEFSPHIWSDRDELTRELHRERRRTVRGSAFAQARYEDAQRPDRIERSVAHEPAVFGRAERREKRWRHLREGHGDRVPVVAPENRPER
jgi:hypothetical protein